MTDLDHIDSLIARFFAAFDNRAGRIPLAQPLEALFAPNPIILKHGPSGCEQYTLRQFIEPRIALLTGGDLVDFHEWETGHSTKIVASIASRTSRYAKRGFLKSQPYAGQGDKFFQFGKFAGGWRIAAVAWADDP
jgi:hypothetical protein